MAAPNIVAVTNIIGKTALATLTTNTANIVTNSTGSNTVDKINDIILSNYTGSNITANVMINRNSSTYYLGGNVAIPANSTIILVGKDAAFYLEEGDVIQANASANNSISITSSYEIIS